MSLIISLVSGIIFAVGLSLSGMTNPAKVIGFLDIFGNWDYSLAFVMMGAVIFNFFSFKFITKKEEPICSSEFYIPTNTLLDKKLIFGSALFGIGWGIAGICPGPGIVNLVTLKTEAFVFIVSMLVGMSLFKIVKKG